MDQKESLIQSSSVNLGMHIQKNTSSAKELKPWTLLICGDFGFISDSPQLVSSSSIQDFIQSSGAEINIAIDKDLPESIDPFSIRFTIKAFSDLSEGQLYQKIPVINALINARDILDMISRNTLTLLEGRTRLSALSLPPSIKTPLLSFLETEPNRAKQTPAPQKGSFADSILSMVDIGERSSTPIDNLISAIGDSENISFSPAQISKFQNIIENMISKVNSAIRNSSQYSQMASSWYSLRNLLKKIGRNRQISVYLHSSPIAHASEGFENACNFFVNNANVPDLILWNYDIGELSLYTIDKLNTLAAITDAIKSLLITSIVPNDPLLKRLISGDISSEFENSETWSAFTCLRTQSHSRSLMLCAPSFYVSTAKEMLTSGGAWLVIDHWISSILSGNSLFNCSALTTTDFLDDQLLFQIAPHKVKELSHLGLTVARTKDGKIILSPNVVLDSSNNERFGSFGFNLLVNRTIRLTNDFFAFNASNCTIELAAEKLYGFLHSQLKSYNVLSSDESLSINIEDTNTINIAVHSDSSIDGHAIDFEFSVNLK